MEDGERFTRNIVRRKIEAMSRRGPGLPFDDSDGSVAVSRCHLDTCHGIRACSARNVRRSQGAQRLHCSLKIMLVCVRWYAAYPLSPRNLEEIMAEIGVAIDQATVRR
jgi:hypothetical protein